MPDIEFFVYRFTASSASCARCKAKVGLHRDKPARPHPNCKCKIVRELGVCVPLGSFRERETQVDIDTESLGIVPAGGALEVATTTGESSGDAVTFEFPGGSYTPTRARDTSRTVNHVFNHNPSVSPDDTLALVDWEELEVVREQLYACVGAQMWLIEDEFTRRRVLAYYQVPAYGQ